RGSAKSGRKKFRYCRGDGSRIGDQVRWCAAFGQLALQCKRFEAQERQFRHSRGQTRCDLPWSFPCALWPLHCWSCCSAAAEVPPAPPLTLRLEARPRSEERRVGRGGA